MSSTRPSAGSIATVLLLALCMLAVASTMRAQLFVAPPSQAACDGARSALAAGSSTWDDVSVLPACQNSALPIRDAIAAARQVADTTRLSVLKSLASALVDSRVAAALLSVGTDAASTEQAKIYLLTALISQVAPRGLVRDLISDQVPSVLTGSCSGGASSAQTPVDIPLTLTDKQRIHDASVALFRGPSTSSRVRWIAACLQDKVTLDFTPSATPSGIQLTYLCGNRFRVRNSNYAEVALTWDVYGSSDNGQESVPAARLDKAFIDQNFVTNVRGTVRLFFNGVLVQTKANGGVACSTPY